MESPTASTNVDISKFLEARTSVEKKCADPLLLRMLEEGVHADITLNAQGGTVKAHRSVLASASPVFQAMFQHDMKEHLTSTVDLLDMTIESLQLFLLLLYITNERTKKMADLNAAVDKHFDDIFDAAHRFQVERRLEVVLVTALDRNLTPSNCWDYYDKTKDSLQSERVVCWAYIKKNFKEVVKSGSTILEMRRNPVLVQTICIMLSMTTCSCSGKSTSAPEETTFKRKRL